MVLTGARVFRRGSLSHLDVAIENERIVDIGQNVPRKAEDLLFPLNGMVIAPGFSDVHVHLREPGFLYKEDIASGTSAAARGGYTCVCAMPNLSPVPDSDAHLKEEEQAIREKARVRVLPYGAITAKENGERLSDMADIAGRVVAFSDDGRGVQSVALMREAMETARSLGKVLCAHCEDMDEIVRGDDRRAEWAQLERDLRLAAETKCRYHACHVSTKESVALIRAAKKSGIDVTCETAPHYLTLTKADAQDDGRFRMNPPLREEEDRLALIEGACDGTVDMIATDHAPHSAEEKSRGFRRSLNGIVGLETAFGVLNTRLVRPGLIPMERLMHMLCVAPRVRFGIPGGIEEGKTAELCVLDPAAEWTVDPAAFLSKGHSTPFEGMRLFGENVMTVYEGKIVWQKETAQ